LDRWLGTVAELRLLVLLAATALASLALLPASASARGFHPAASAGYGPYTSCPRGFSGTKTVPAMAVWNIQARHITCRTAYRLINNFPGAPGPYKPYRCKDHFEGDGFRFVCTDARKAFRFNAAGA
jgi:hypothetical protein